MKTFTEISIACLLACFLPLTSSLAQSNEDNKASTVGEVTQDWSKMMNPMAWMQMINPTTYMPMMNPNANMQAMDPQIRLKPSSQLFYRKNVDQIRRFFRQPKLQ